LRRHTQKARSGTFTLVIAGPILVLEASSDLLLLAGLAFLFVMASRTNRLKVHLYPHLFRHACAPRLRELEADLLVIQDFLGHESADTTQIYLRVSPSQQGRAIRAESSVWSVGTSVAHGEGLTGRPALAYPSVPKIRMWIAPYSSSA